jgi:hypothetical protein
LSLGFSFELKRYLRGFLLLAIATAVFSLVNIAISTIPNTVTIGGDIGQLCGNVTTVTVTLTPTSTPPSQSNIANITLYDPFDQLDTAYWVSLIHPWIVDNGWLRTSKTELNFDNAVYYIVDFIEEEHDTFKITTSVLLRNPNSGENQYYCVFLATTDLNTRLMGCIETYGGSTSVYVYLRMRIYMSGSVSLLAGTTIEIAGYSTIHPARLLKFTVTRVNETHVNIIAEAENRGSWYSLSPVTVQVDWSKLGYFGFFMTRYLSGSGNLEGFDYVEVEVTSPYATSTVTYNYNYPPPIPTVTTTTTVTETKIIDLSKDILVILLGSFIRVLSFGIYVVYIVKTIKHFTPEF